MLLPLLLPIPAPLHDLETFEAKVRPVLVERCYRCHNSVDRREGGLALDHAAGLLKGGDSGPALVPGDPEASLLLQAVRHADGAPRMPREEPRLEPEDLLALSDWILSGAPDPRDTVPTAESLAAETSWEMTVQRRLEWWSYQPVTVPEVPTTREGWARNDLDRFVLASLTASGDSPAPELGLEALLRRVSFVLTGLPPTSAEREIFLSDEEPGAYQRVVDRLLASPHHAERMARHWMDLVRYAESHGSEGDPSIPNAYRYRDYLVRAFDQDVPWNRLVQEHVAGDLLSPRVDPETEINDAEVALGHYRFVQHGYAPVEPLDDQVRFIDSQIEVLGKAFLGQTISCARCHDHKFDPISQRDYYALYGVMASKRPAQRTVDSAERRTRKVTELTAGKPAIQRALGAAWLAAIADLPGRLNGESDAWEEAEKDVAHPLHPWVKVREAEDVPAEWTARLAEYHSSEDRASAALGLASVHMPLVAEAARSWFAHGSVLDNEATAPGSFSVLPEGDRVLTTVLPRGIYSHLLSSKHSGLLTSPSFDVEKGSLFVRVMGGGGARTRYAMQLHPRVAGPVFKSHSLDMPRPQWRSWNMDYWAGDETYVEVATARDLPVEARGGERSFWGLTEVRFLPRGAALPRDEAVEFQAPLFEDAEAPLNADNLAKHYAEVLASVVRRWTEGTCTDADARFLDPFVRHGLLPVHLEDLPDLAPLVAAYRAHEAEVPVPIRAPGVVAGPQVDQPMFERGDYRKPGEPVSQRFFDWLDGTAYGNQGRLQLAQDMVRGDNPLPARVAVNRLWTWVFGSGLVTSVDNLGLLGTQPEDAALLDHLTARFVEGGWSAREMLRTLVTSSTFRQVRPAQRLDAESLRDALLLVSGRLDPRRFGGSTGENSARRSLYMTQKRGAPPAFLETFDQPAPHTTCGLRPVTNVPAQGLALLNDPFVLGCARQLAQGTRGLEDGPRVREMFASALGREPTLDEVHTIQDFLAAQRGGVEQARQEQARLNRAVAQAQERQDSLLALGRERALSQRAVRSSGGASAPPLLPEPFAAWEFDGDLTDERGRMPGKIHGNARVEGGRLVLEGGVVFTDPLPSEIGEKTLEAWASLSGLGQKGCGVITLQATDGGVFDSIVFAERQDRRWMAGSDGFNRTQDVSGPPEGSQELIHLAITYAADGTITVYRGGKPYGTGYRRAGLARYPAGHSQVLLGARHGAVGSLRSPMRGSIERAALYDRALTPEEIAACASGDPDFVSRAQALASLDDAERAEHGALTTGLALDREQLEALRPDLLGGGDRPWYELAHSLFQLEEFRYLR